jgi:hypothetical protein
MGGIYLEIGDAGKTVELWTKVLALDPENIKVKE